MRIPDEVDRDDSGDSDDVEQVDLASSGGTATAVASMPLKAVVETPKIEPVVAKAAPASTPKPIALPKTTPAPVVVTPAPAAVTALPVETAKVPQPVPQPAPAPSVPAPSTPGDAISEAPSAEWFVRPPSGGQYGPANAEIMRKWLGEGRVSADSLVWRGGWTDWQTAAHVFPQLAPTTPVAAEPVPVITGLSANKSSAVVRSVKTRKKSLGFAVAMVVMLGLISIALLGIFIFLVMNNTGTA